MTIVMFLGWNLEVMLASAEGKIHGTDISQPGLA
jgi:hypothetical protein